MGLVPRIYHVHPLSLHPRCRGRLLVDSILGVSSRIGPTQGKPDAARRKIEDRRAFPRPNVIERTLERVIAVSPGLRGGDGRDDLERRDHRLGTDTDILGGDAARPLDRAADDDQNGGDDPPVGRLRSRSASLLRVVGAVS